MLGCVLVPLDGSALAERALPFAATLSRTRGGRLLLLRVLTPRPPRGEQLVLEPTAHAELDAVADRLRGHGLEVEVEVSTTLFGDVANMIVAAARHHTAELIVMSTHGRGGLGRWVYSSVAEQVMRLAPVPILLVPANCERTWPVQRSPHILLALDGSDLAARAIDPTGTLAHALEAHVTLLQVLPPLNAAASSFVYENQAAVEAAAARSLADAADTLRQAGVRVSVRIEFGRPAACIAEVAREDDVDAIVMATHGRSGLSRVVLGSVATETLQRAGLPVLLVGPPSSSVASHEVPAPEPRQSLTLLVALDLSVKADAALEPTSRLARASDANVVLLNVFRPSVDVGHVVAGTEEERLAYVKTERLMYLDSKAEQLPGVRVTTRVEILPQGEEVEEAIARVAREVQADVLVLVSGRLASPGGVLLGSFAQGALRQSACPVLIVKPEPAPA
jgi:nucleotide-binding universal stress UspA family protein